MKREQLGYYGLLFGCPMEEETENCVFKEIRKMNIRDRIEYIQSASIKDRTDLIEKHRLCIAQREDKVPFSRIAIL